MGFASKFEDETERRNEDSPRPIGRRLAYVFNAYGVKSDLPERHPELEFDEHSEKRLSEILKRLEQSHQRKLKALASTEGLLGGNSARKIISTHKKLVADIDTLIIFLAPYVRQMKGERRRNWNRKIEQLKKAKYLL